MMRLKLLCLKTTKPCIEVQNHFLSIKVYIPDSLVPKYILLSTTCTLHIHTVSGVQVPLLIQMTLEEVYEIWDFINNLKDFNFTDLEEETLQNKPQKKV